LEEIKAFSLSDEELAKLEIAAPENCPHTPLSALKATLCYLPMEATA